MISIEPFLQDQLVPFMVLDVAGAIPGLPGLFMAGVFSGSLRFLLSLKLHCERQICSARSAADWTRWQRSLWRTSSVPRWGRALVSRISCILASYISWNHPISPVCCSSSSCIYIFTKTSIPRRAQASSSHQSLLCCLWRPLLQRYFRHQVIFTTTNLSDKDP